jgi:hypothetical protein
MQIYIGKFIDSSSWNGHEIHKDYWYNVLGKYFTNEQEERDAKYDDLDINNANNKHWAPKPKQPKKHWGTQFDNNVYTRGQAEKDKLLVTKGWTKGKWN